MPAMAPPPLGQTSFTVAERTPLDPVIAVN